MNASRVRAFLAQLRNVARISRNREVVLRTTSIATQIRHVTVQSSRLASLTEKLKQKASRAQEEWDSDSDSDDEGRHVKGESEFWRRKMRTLHRLLDVNKDGVVSFDDFRLLTERFTDLGHLSEQHHREFEEIIQEAWELHRGAVDPYNLITTEQFLQDMCHVLNDASLRRKAHRFLPYFFKAVDKDRSGEISVEEFKLFFQCLGLSNKAAEMSFKTIDINHDGKLSLEEFVKLGREYLLTEDERKPSKYFWGPLED